MPPGQCPKTSGDAIDRSRVFRQLFDSLPRSRNLRQRFSRDFYLRTKPGNSNNFFNRKPTDSHGDRVLMTRHASSFLVLWINPLGLRLTLQNYLAVRYTTNHPVVWDTSLVSGM